MTPEGACAFEVTSLPTCSSSNLGWGCRKSLWTLGVQGTGGVCLFISIRTSSSVAPSGSFCPLGSPWVLLLCFCLILPTDSTIAGTQGRQNGWLRGPRQSCSQSNATDPQDRWDLDESHTFVISSSLPLML